MKKSERTRQYIIDKASPVFNSRGFAGTSLADLIEVTGLTKGAIYGNFANKDEVALAAFDANFQRITNYLKAEILAHEHAIDRLLVYPKVYRHFLQIPFLQAGCPILNTATEADDTHPQLREKAANALSFWKQSLENQVLRGIARQELNSNTKPTQVAVVMMTVIEGAIMQCKVTGTTTELHIAMAFLEDFINGLSV